MASAECMLGTVAESSRAAEQCPVAGRTADRRSLSLQADYTNSHAMARSRGSIILVVIFTLFGLNAWVQVLNAIIGGSDDPTALVVLQTLVGTAGIAAAWGAWSGARWAPVAAVSYGVVTAAMLASLGPLLDLATAEMRGIWSGAAGVLLFGLWAGWYLRRSARRTARL